MKKYDKPLKNCKDCRYCNYVLIKDEKKFFCKIYDLFVSKCEKKVVRSEKI
jgi:hypothetical protein